MCESLCYVLLLLFFFVKQKTAYEMRISDWSSDVCSSDLGLVVELDDVGGARGRRVDVEPRQAGRNLGIGDREQVAILGQQLVVAPRSEERRVGKECVSTCRSRV